MHLKIPLTNEVTGRKLLQMRGSAPLLSSISRYDCPQSAGTAAAQYMLVNIQQYIIENRFKELTECP